MNVLLMLLLLAACSSEEETKPKNLIDTIDGNIETNSEIEYIPDTYLNLYQPFKILEDEKPLIDDLIKYIEASYENKEEGVYHGYISEKYINQPFNIEWVDKTEGRLDVKNKLMPILDRIEERCPGVRDTMLPLSVHVFEATKGMWSKSNGLYASNTSIKYSKDSGLGNVVQTLDLVKPAISILGDYYDEDLIYYGQGQQTSYEQKGFYVWEVPEDSQHAFWALDNVFAHELGHHYISSWMSKNGYSDIKSKFFSEYLAEFFRGVCYGNYAESPKNQSYKRREHQRYRISCPNPDKPSVFNQIACEELNHFPYVYYGASKPTRHRKHTHYNPHLDDFIGNEVYLNKFDSAQTWKAVEATLASMKGEKAGCFPSQIMSDEQCMWQIVQDGHSNKEENKPLIWTKREFLQKFCDHYPCGYAKEIFREQYETYSEHFIEW